MHLSPVDEPPPHAALEEAAAAVAGVDAVMFAAAGVSAHFADQRRAQGLSRGRALGCGSEGSVSALFAICAAGVAAATAVGLGKSHLAA